MPPSSNLAHIRDYAHLRSNVVSLRPEEAREGDLVPFPISQRHALEAFLEKFKEWEAKAIEIVQNVMGETYSYEEEGDITHGALEELFLYVRRNPRFNLIMGERYLELVEKKATLIAFQSRFFQWLEHQAQEEIPEVQIRAFLIHEVLPVAPAGFTFAFPDREPEPLKEIGPMVTNVQSINDGRYLDPA